MFNKKYLSCVLLVLCHEILAAPLPSAGSQIQQIPPSPNQLKITPEVNVEQDATPAIPQSDQLTIIVKEINISGALIYKKSDLLAIAGFKPDKKLGLSELHGMAAKIADYYHRNGYFVTQVYLPAQDIKDGVVTIAVIEGRYGNIVLHNQTRLANNLPIKILGGLSNSDPISSAPLESRLLLLSDLPGVRIKSYLTPGLSAGSSDLSVDITPGKQISASVDADNAGNRYTGENRIGATVNFNNPLGQGDVVTLRALTSGSGLNYARVSYQIQWNNAKVGVSYTNLIYALGQEFASLQAKGSADTASLYASYPLIRSRDNNLFVQLDYDSKTFQDRIDSTFSVTDKHAGALVASINGDHHDNFHGGGLSSYSLAWTSGHLDLQTPSLQSLDAVTVQSNGAYDKLGINALRLQSITDTTSLYVSISGQLASKNLDVSEKMELGGMYAVRAYPEGEAYADQGYVLNLETRTQLPKLFERMSGQTQFIVFIDSGSVETNKTPWLSTQNSRTLSGAGIGLNWTSYDSWALKTYYARKVGNEAATSAPDEFGRFWLQAVKYF